MPRDGFAEPTYQRVLWKMMPVAVFGLCGALPALAYEMWGFEWAVLLALSLLLTLKAVEVMYP